MEKVRCCVTSVVDVSDFDEQVLLVPGEFGKVHRCVELCVYLHGARTCRQSALLVAQQLHAKGATACEVTQGAPGWST